MDIASELETWRKRAEAAEAQLAAERPHGDINAPTTAAQRRESYEFGQANGYNRAIMELNELGGG